MKIIAGQYKGRIIKTANGQGYRPAMGKVRESLFSMLESRGLQWPEINVLDVFAGSGALGLEALSRGANYVLFIERNSKACLIIRENMAMLDIPPQKARVVQAEALDFLDRCSHRPFELVFVDPPYGRDMARPSLNRVLRSDLLSHGGLVCAEIETRLTFEPQFHSELELIKDKHFGQTRILIWRKT